MALFWGEKDPILPLRQGRSMLAQSTGITLTTYPKCGHFPQLDIAQTFANDLKAFFCDPDRPFWFIYSEKSKNRLPGILEDPMKLPAISIPDGCIAALEQ
jgi:hypothetical protein